MGEKDILEMIFLVKSCTNNLDPRWNHQFDEEVDVKCRQFCEKHKIKITHGSPYKELRHKCYYYINKNIESIINKGIDLYNLRKEKLITDTQIVDKLIKTKLSDKVFIKDGAIGVYY